MGENKSQSRTYGTNTSSKNEGRSSSSGRNWSRTTSTIDASSGTKNSPRISHTHSESYGDDKGVQHRTTLTYSDNGDGTRTVTEETRRIFIEPIPNNEEPIEDGKPS